ncbi:IPExxxVDY family protein [uncultured Flavobacterium sp.]|uniref:IPExxxVDY family protein n=1 Tax=uncultured Flavobacterium sp. TaxID=165435 RepID=UPI0025FF2E7F|nr:IPExxxVDY family protein [uncultured Flavobacterium sp.]
MAIHKLQIDDFVTVDYELIAIHSSLEDYRLAYFINQSLPVLLEKSHKDINMKFTKSESCFSRFVFEDIDTDSIWNLIQNKNSVVTTQEQEVTSLFSNIKLDMITNSYFLPEFKKVDYILKVENIPTPLTSTSLINELLAVKHITTAYTIEHNKLKSKNNLIF